MIPPTRHSRAWAELTAYRADNADALRRAPHPPIQWRPVLRAAGLTPRWRWGRSLLDMADAYMDPIQPDPAPTAAVLEAVVDFVRRAIGDEYPQDPRCLVNPRKPGPYPLPLRSRYAEWTTTDAGVVCSCGRMTWGWTRIPGPVYAHHRHRGLVQWQVLDECPTPPPTPVANGLEAAPLAWWRVQCMRCGLVCLTTATADPDLDERPALAAAHLADVWAYQPTQRHSGAGDHPAVLFGNRAGAPHTAARWAAIRPHTTRRLPTIDVAALTLADRGEHAQE